VLVSLALALALWSILVVHLPTTPGLQSGRPSPMDIRARRTVSFVSNLLTDQERFRVENSDDTQVYLRDSDIPTQQRTQLADLLQTISQVRNDPTIDKRNLRDKLTSLPNSTLVISPALAAQLSSLSDSAWENVSQQSLNLYDRAVSENNYALNAQTMTQLRERSLPYWSTLASSSKQQQELILLFSSSFLKANWVLDEEATKKRKQEALDAVKPISVQILQNESIVRQGDVITPIIQEKLEALGELHAETSWSNVAGKGLLAGLIAALFGTYLGLLHREVWLADRPLLVVAGLFALTALAARLVLPLDSNWPYAFPLGMTALLLAVLFKRGLALIAVALLSLLIAFLGDSQLPVVAALLLGSMAGVFAIGRGERSLTFLIAGLVIALTTALTQIAFWLTTFGDPALDQLPLILIFSMLNGALSGLIGLGLYNLVGHMADIVTPLQLMELAHPAQPLLRKLIREAPGTYYHSVAVANLAESAAEAIGADALLLRVAAYYHDIGKTIRPFFFTDNQSDRENVHNELDPHTSAEIIADHVREGMKMAHAAGLPRQVVEFIPAHHGTSIINHFYQMALQQEDTVDLEHYRYPGPRPRTREQAIMMLADSVEATVRSKVQNGKVISAREDAPGTNGRGQNGKQTLEELVNSIIDERTRSGQLDESPLTLQDMARIRQAFINTLQGIYHPRVDYAPQIVKHSG
jgi:cyclic-di-AMP phosphodiesterase PgpH